MERATLLADNHYSDSLFESVYNVDKAVKNVTMIMK